MVDIQRLYTLIDQLPRHELEQLSQYIQHRQAVTVWQVPTEEIRAIEQLMRPTHDLTRTMRDDEINSILDVALAEVRHERKAQSND